MPAMNSPEEPKLITIMTALLLSGIGDALILGLYVLSFVRKPSTSIL